MKRHTMGRAPDYTNAALVTLGINLFCLLCVIWGAFGFFYALVLAFTFERAITLYSRR